MINEKVLANAVATVSAVFYILCRIAVAVAPNVLFAIGNSWFHTFTLDAAKVSGNLTFSMFILGLVTLTALAWVVTYAVALLYNRWEKKV